MKKITSGIFLHFSKLDRHLSLGLALSLSFLVIVSGISIFSILSIISTRDAINERYTEDLVMAERLHFAAESKVANAGGLLLHRHSMEYREQINEARHNFLTDLARLRAHAQSPDLTRLLDQIAALEAQHQEAIERVFVLNSRMDTRKNLEPYLQNQVKPLRRQLDELISNLSKTLQARLNSALARASDQSSRSIWLVAGLAASAFVLIAGLSWLHRKLSEEQKRALVERQSFSGRMHKAEEDERARLSREIHDELGQWLTGLKMQLHGLRSRASRAEPVPTSLFDQALSSIDTLVQLVRSIASRLRPPILDLGLEPALEWLTNDFEKRTGIVCRMTSQMNQFEVSSEAASAIFRIAQEALNNAAKYANTPRIDVRLFRAEDDIIHLEIEDQGQVQVQSYERPGSLGIMGMKERARNLGGRISIETGDLTGTRVVASFEARAIEHRNEKENAVS